MILDTSAVVAMLAAEPGYLVLRDAAVRAHELHMSTGTYVELQAVTARRGTPELGRRADRLLAELGVAMEPFDSAQAHIAARAYREYGRGSGHPAGLNLGDCYAYALATHLDLPLLFTGEDFAHTDVRRAHPPGALS